MVTILNEGRGFSLTENDRIDIRDDHEDYISEIEGSAELNEQSKETVRNKEHLLYTVNEIPPVPVIVFYVLQNVLPVLSILVTASNIVADSICAPSSHTIRAKLCCMSLMMTGVCTILSTMFGIRLPILQGASFAFLYPLTFAWNCSVSDVSSSRGTFYTNTSEDVRNEEEIYHRVREIMGSLMLAAAFETVIGACGLVGYLSQFIGPLTVSVFIGSMGISFSNLTMSYCTAHWGLSSLCIIVSLIGVFFFGKILVPIPKCKISRRERGNRRNIREKRITERIPLLQVLAILIGILITWFVCYIFTLTDVLPNDPSKTGYYARTDTKSELFNAISWFYFPYPGQFGTPLFNLNLFLGFVCGSLLSILESVGDYFILADITNSPKPSRKVLTRGIMVEGLGCLLSASLGSGLGHTSYTNNIALIGISRNASRIVLLASGAFLVFISVFGKAGAMLVSMPFPAVGGSLFVMLALMTSYAFFNLRHVDMISSRNMTIFGVAIYVGLVIPQWLKLNPEAINTGNFTADETIKNILSTPYIVSSFLAAILDNAIKGSREERG